MAKLKQSANQYSVYLGWYGIHSGDSRPFELQTWSEIYAVYKIDSLGATGYIAGTPSYFQSFTKLEVGNGYLIILKPGTSLIDIPNFVNGSTDRENIVLENDMGMINPKPDDKFFQLEQSEVQYTTHLGWYGVVNNNDCDETEYDFTQNENIAIVYRFENGQLSQSYQSGAPSWTNTFTKMTTGNMYYVVLKPGTEGVEIKNFISTSSTKKTENNSLFTIRKKTKVFVFLAKSDKKKFNETEYYLTETDEDDNQIKSKLKVSDIHDLLNKKNYIYPVQPGFSKQITGSVSDYFKALTFDQLDFQFEIFNFGYGGDENDPDDSAYQFIATSKKHDSEELKKWFVSAYTQMQERRKDIDQFPKQLDDTTKNFRNPLTMGIVIHTHPEIRARNCSVDGGDGSRKISFVSIVDNNNQNRIEPIGKFIHELIHSFDVKDLYTSSGIGFSKADPMAYGFWGHTSGSTGKYFPYFPSGYTRYKMTQFDTFKSNIIEISESTKDIELFSPVQKNEIVRVSHPEHSDVWYVDYRTPTSNTNVSYCVDYDQELVESGISIIHEFPTLFPDQTSYIPCHSRAESGYTVSLEEQDGLFQLQETNRSIAIEFDEADNKSDFYKQGDEFSPFTMPSSVSYKGKPTGIKIHNIRPTQSGSVLFDLDFTEPPTYKFRGREYPCEIYKVEFYRNNEGSLIKLREFATRKKVPYTTSKKPLKFDFDNSYFTEEVIQVKIETRGIPHGTKLALKYKKKNATEFTLPGDWAISTVDLVRDPRGYVTFDIPKGLLPIYLQNNRNHLMFEVIDSDVFPWIEFIDVINL